MTKMNIDPKWADKAAAVRDALKAMADAFDVRAEDDRQRAARGVGRGAGSAWSEGARMLRAEAARILSANNKE